METDNPIATARREYLASQPEVENDSMLEFAMAVSLHKFQNSVSRTHQVII